MSEREINKLDPDDIGLQQVMGSRFQDLTKKPMVESISTRTTNTTKTKKVAQKSTDKPMEAQWDPARPETNQMEKLKACAKALLLFGGLSCLIFYWESAGLMAESIAVPCMCVCTALAGLGVGKSIAGGNR